MPFGGKAAKAAKRTRRQTHSHQPVISICPKEAAGTGWTQLFRLFLVLDANLSGPRWERIFLLFLFLFQSNLYQNGAVLGPGPKEERTLPSLSWWQCGIHKPSFRLVSLFILSPLSLCHFQQVLCDYLYCQAHFLWFSALSQKSPGEGITFSWRWTTIICKALEKGGR